MIPFIFHGFFMYFLDITAQIRYILEGKDKSCRSIQRYRFTVEEKARVRVASISFG